MGAVVAHQRRNPTPQLHAARSKLVVLTTIVLLALPLCHSGDAIMQTTRPNSYDIMRGIMAAMVSKAQSGA